MIDHDASAETELKVYFAVGLLRRWDNSEVSGFPPGKGGWPVSGPGVGFLPVFETRKEAEAYTSDYGGIIFQIGTGKQ